MTVTAPTPVDVVRYEEPEGIAARASVVILTGRGESPAAYARLGRRLAADAYRVRIVTSRLDDLDATRDQVEAALAEEVRPHVLLGSDAGANVAALLGPQVGADALVLAGVVVDESDVALSDAGWEEELDARSACPAYRRVLTGDDAFQRGGLAAGLPADLAHDTLLAGSLPTLVVHGDADPVSPVDAVLSLAVDGANVRTAVVAGGRHDVVNDVNHRAVAATIVLFLESLRLGAHLPAIITPSAL